MDTTAVAIWNRAAMDPAASELLVGDAALAALLRVHNIAMNGGVLHSMEFNSPSEVERAVSGYRYFGLDDAADVIEEAVRRLAEAEGDDDALDALESSLDAEYAAVVTDDDVLGAAFERRLTDAPSDFAPVE